MSGSGWRRVATLDQDRGTAKALLHQPARQALIHNSRVLREPIHQRTGKGTHDVMPAGCERGTHVVERFQHCRVLVDMTTSIAVGCLRHPAVFLGEMAMGMLRECIECDRLTIVGGLQYRVDTRDELAVGVIHLVVAERVSVVPGESGEYFDRVHRQASTSE